MLLFATIILNVFFLDKHYSIETDYLDVELLHKKSSSFTLSNYAIKTKEQILIAASTPEELELALLFKQSALLSITIEPRYPIHICGTDGPGINQAKLYFESDSKKYSFDLSLQNKEKFTLNIAAGEQIKVSAQNTVVNTCGRANLIVQSQNPQQLIVAICWFASWAILIFLCGWCRSSALHIGLALGFNVLLIWAESTLAPINHMTVVFTTMVSWLLLGFLVLTSLLLRQSFLFSAFIALILVSLFSLPMTFVMNVFVFSKPVSVDTIHAILQSYLSQIIEFWGAFLGLRAALVFALVAFFFLVVAHLMRRAELHRLKSISLCVIIILIALPITQSTYYGSHAYRLVNDSFNIYQKEIKQLQEISSKRKVSDIKADLKKEFLNNTTVVIVGESVNKNHLSAYGYVRKTTPFLDKRLDDGEVILFDNAYSNHTHSNPSVSYMLTAANQYSKKKWLDSPSVLNIASAANLTTTWLSNHRMAGGWSNHITTIAKEADRTETINYKIGVGNLSSNFDGKLIPMFFEAIEDKPEQLVFLHFYNSHINYCNRYPNSLDDFDTNQSELNYGARYRNRSATAAWIDCYDKSVKYTDTLIEQVVQKLQAQSNPAVVLYLSDHSEEVFGAKGHNSSVFTLAMSNIPLTVWANNAWKTQHANIWNALKDNSQKVFTNDRLFELVLGLSGLQSPLSEKENMLSSSSYQSPKVPFTLHGRVRLNKADNWQYWQSVNINNKRLKDLPFQGLNIDSLGKAKYARFLGIDEFNFVVNLDENNRYQLFNQHGGDQPLMLSSLLNELDLNALDCISLNVKNADTHNRRDIQEANTNLVKRFGIGFCEQSSDDVLDLFAPDFTSRLSKLNPKSNSVLKLNLRSIYDAK